MTEKAEIEIGAGATIKGKVVAPTEQAAIGQANTQSSVEAGRDSLQQQYEQRTVIRDLDQRRDDRHYNESRNVGASNYNFESQDNARVWEAIVELTKTMDNLPARMATVEAIVLPIPAPLMTAVPIALNLPGKQSVTAVVPAAAIVAEPKPPPWMLIMLVSMGVLLFLTLLAVAIFLGSYLF